ncbi:MAG: hypothetical protein ACO1QB_14600 [Verrucomicrobiales bacterium]
MKHTMNARDARPFKTLAAISCVAVSTWIAEAGPLQKEYVASSAKWVLHLDGELFRNTKVGSFISRELVDKKFAEAEAKANLNLDFDFSKVTSITAYSNDFEKDTGVLLIKTTADVKKDIQSIIDRANKEGKPQNIIKVQDASYPLYKHKGESFMAPDVAGILLFSKSRSQLEEARNVLLRKGESLAQKNTFSEVKNPPGNYFMATVQGLNDQAPVPANAQILRQATGGSLFLGENKDQTVAHVALKGKTAEAATQITQVVQGLVALINLKQDGDEKLRKLAESALVNSEGQQVTIQVAFPSETIINDIAKREGITR